MGLFDMFKSDKGDQMTAHFAFACSLLYMMKSDGEMDNEEIGHLLSVLGGSKDGNTIGVGANNQEMLNNAMKYTRSHSIDEFLKEATPKLSDAQRISILCNLIDSSLSDGEAEMQEQEVFGKLMSAFGITEERFKPFFEVIVIKNDRKIFLQETNPKNDPNYRVKLSI
jgi:uncharacterized tellurite resistance protein B-like protein